MEHLKKIEFTESFPLFEIPHVALFDDRQISAEEVTRRIKAGEPSSRIIVCTQKQFNNVFASLINKEQK